MNASTPIILIDDNRAWLEALAEYLRAKGISVYTATDPRRALEFMEGHSVSLVICDYNMPNMDGLQVLRCVRQRNGNIAVVLLTSQEEPDLERAALAAGAGGFLPKSIAPASLLRRLLDTIKSLLGLPSTQAPPPSWQRLLPSPYPRERSGLFGWLCLPKPVTSRARSA
jgi:CheY-like chemotaxis protein